ncbi:Mur ligase [Lipomyces arxii]|uniref:Mur ligase n=1 Tax=Lipomyces arxii TaxID=56418 RepID=UPI0034CE9525
MSINLGLQRMKPLMESLLAPQKTFKVFHVAGTNGKGSVCAYLSSILYKSSIPVGRFTSPFLLEPRDSIFVNESPISQALFADVKKLVEQTAQRAGVRPTDFELLTATAMEVFNRKQLDVAVIEVGVGGKEDATNIEYKRRGVLGTIITRVGLDHQNLLGNSIKEIALQKAGIMRAKTLCTVSGDNVPEVLSTIETQASSLDQISVVKPDEILSQDDGVYLETDSYGKIKLSETPLNGDYQYMNLACAVRALDRVAKLLPTVTRSTIEAGIREVQWQGRLQFISAEPFGGNEDRKILLDGAHNVQAASSLGKFVNENLRGDEKITWVMALSGNREATEILSLLGRPGDKFYAVGFSPVDTMSWVVPQDLTALNLAAKDLDLDAVPTEGLSLQTVISNALSSCSAPVVICGSLYLISDVLRLTKSTL